MQTSYSAEIDGGRPEVSVYWKPGCSSCLKTKEFVEEHGIFYESVNVEKSPQAVKEIMGAGLRGVPVVRRGDRFIYAQSLDDVAAFLEVERRHAPLSHTELLNRWDALMTNAKTIIASFPEDLLPRLACIGRNRTVKDLSSHVFQIPEAFMMSVDEGLVDTRDMGADPREAIRTRADLLQYVEKVHADYQRWRADDAEAKIPARMQTHYGEQPSAQVLERGVWHSTQHARQLDYVAAGMGAELRIPPELYAGLPLPKRLWA